MCRGSYVPVGVHLGVEQIEVLWLRGRAIYRAFEVEQTTRLPALIQPQRLGLKLAQHCPSWSSPHRCR